MPSEYVNAIREELKNYKKEFPKYGPVVNVYPKGTVAAARYEAEIWGFRDGYVKALVKVLIILGA